MTTTIISVTGAKGGVGTTTLAVSLALTATHQGSRVLLVGNLDELAAVLGSAAPSEDGETLEEIVLSGLLPAIVKDGDSDYDVVIIDGPSDFADHRILATTGCYLALRRTVRMTDPDGFDGFVLLDEHGRALGERDVTDVLGIPCLGVIPRRTSVARSIDAGKFIRYFQGDDGGANAIARVARAVLDGFAPEPREEVESIG